MRFLPLGERHAGRLREDSFTADTFDVTDYIRYGEENTLAVKVYRWCDASWLEDQIISI